MESMKLKRHIIDEFREYLQVFPVTGIIGPKQVGKTTLAKSMTADKDFLYLDLERQTDREKLTNDPTFVLSQFKDKCVVLNEIQFMPELFNELRGLRDEHTKAGRLGYIELMLLTEKIKR